MKISMLFRNERSTQQPTEICSLYSSSIESLSNARTYYIYDTSISALHSSRQRSAAIQSKGNRAQSSAADWQLVQRSNIEPTRFPRNNGVSPRQCYNNDTAISPGYMFILVD